ncbi:unnamed protein product, partial [Hapterophycus canaliculatus]
MNLEDVIPLPLEDNEYVAAAISLLLDDTKQTKIKVTKHLQNVCIVYACLAVKRNAGVVGNDAKHAAAAKGYKEIAVPGFFRWARDNNYTLPSWLTFDMMGRTTMTGAPILYQSGKRLWSRFDQAMREMKRDFNPIWDRCV